LGTIKPIHPTGNEDTAQKPLKDLGLEWPLVSVVVTCCNYARYIEPCLHSIQKQSYRRFECIVVDDASTDNSAEIVEQYIRGHGLEQQFRLVRRAVNGGQLAAFRTGLEHSNGRFIAFVDADDLLQERFLHVHLEVHLTDFPVAFTSSNQYQINEHGEMIAGVHPDLRTDNGRTRVVPICLFNPIWVWATTSSMMFRRAVLDAVMPRPEADEGFRRCADNYICHFANLLGGSILIPEVLGYYRRHGENCFSRNPLIGGRGPTGDMRNHPAHLLVLSTIRRHMLARMSDFVGLKTARGLARTLSRITPPGVAALMLLQALFRPAYPMPAWMALRLLVMSLSKYIAFWFRCFTRKPPFVQLKLEPAGTIPQ
jgi:hypothetical protein